MRVNKKEVYHFNAISHFYKMFSSFITVKMEKYKAHKSYKDEGRKTKRLLIKASKL